MIRPIFIILLTAVIMTGCQHSYNQRDFIYTQETQLNSTHEDFELRESSQESSSGEKNKTGKEGLNLISDGKTSAGKIKKGFFRRNNTSAQKKIDQALELCNLAQEMWEEGNLEEALSSLDSAYYSILGINLDNFPEFSQEKEDIRYLISKRILEIYASRQIVVNGQHNEIPIIMNKYVQKEINNLTGPERKFFVQSMERSGRYRPFIVAELKKAGLPEEISWLPLIESGFKTHALSSARALGLWQFIPSTGYKFGLNRNYYIDERLDPEKSTKAAIAYLKELHNLFGDWTTALASYNCGESKVLRIIRRQKINYLDNFWDLYEKLPRETARYIPRFFATLHIVNNLEKYNIKINKPLLPINFKSYEIKKQLLLKDIAREINVDTNLMKTLNPELRYSLLPPEPYQVNIPAYRGDLFLSRLDKIRSSYSPQSFIRHRVRKGETLSEIAEKYKTSIRQISALNNIYKIHRITAGQVIKVPGRGTNIADAHENITRTSPKNFTYKVKRGDNLWIIAKRFGITTKKIMALNKLSNTTLHIGQKLYIASKADINYEKKGAIYHVKPGDSPYLIAKKHDISLRTFFRLNDLNKTSKIFPGQKVIIK